MIPYAHESLLSFALRLRAIDLAHRLGVRWSDLLPVLGADREVRYWFHRELGQVREES